MRGPLDRCCLHRVMLWVCHFERKKRPCDTLFRLLSGQVRPRQGTEICNFGVPSPLEALHWIFCFFSSIYLQFSKTSPLKSGESSEKSSGENRVKSCHVCGCHGFVGPDSQALQAWSSQELISGRKNQKFSTRGWREEVGD